MDFVTIPAGRYDLGWRFDAVLGDAVNTALDAAVPRAQRMASFSKARQVELPAFAIATTTIPAQSLMEGMDEDELDAIDSIEALCELLDQKLEANGLRLPTEDEIEAACGHALFPWGDELPDGVPLGDQTKFTKHLAPTALGLVLDGNPYQVEIVRTGFKLGDGGEAVCGGYPWPWAWLCFAPCYRVAEGEAEDLMFEFLEEATVRPVRR